MGNKKMIYLHQYIFLKREKLSTPSNNVTHFKQVQSTKVVVFQKFCSEFRVLGAFFYYMLPGFRYISVTHIAYYAFIYSICYSISYPH